MNRAGLILAVTVVALALVLLGRKVVMTDAVTKKIAVGIAFAEGFYSKGSRPQRNHNPGDFETDITGKGVGKDGPYIIYRTDADGWEALYKQVKLMFSGSRYYNPDMTLTDIARKWTETEQSAWASNVASKIGVSPATRLKDIQA